MDIGTPEKYMQTHDDIMNGACELPGVRFDSQRKYIDSSAEIDATAIITGPVYIGSNVKIGACATVGPNAVIGDNVCIKEGGSVVNSILWNKMNVRRHARMREKVAALEFHFCAEPSTGIRLLTDGTRLHA